MDSAAFITLKLPVEGGAAVAQWIRSRLPSCRPGFESQAHHLCFFNLNLNLNCNVLKRRKETEKGAGIGLFLKKKLPGDCLVGRTGLRFESLIGQKDAINEIFAGLQFDKKIN